MGQEDFSSVNTEKDSVNENQNVGDTAGELKTGQGWQPIETAPRGRDVLMYTAHAGYTIADWGRYAKYNSGAFTHWMPLPDPPEVN